MPLLPPQNDLHNFSYSEVPDAKKDVGSSTTVYTILSTGGRKEQEGLTDLTEYSDGSFSILALEFSLQEEINVTHIEDGCYLSGQKGTASCSTNHMWLASSWSHLSPLIVTVTLTGNQVTDYSHFFWLGHVSHS